MENEMKLFDKPFIAYLKTAKIGIALLFAVSTVRFLLSPVFHVDYEQGTDLASLTILMPILMLFYAIKIANDGGTYRDLLGVSAALALSSTAFIIIAIAIDDFAGIQTYFTDPKHVDHTNTYRHIASHILGTGILTTLVLWVVGSLIYTFARGSGKKAVA